MWKRFLQLLPGFAIPNLLAPLAIWGTRLIVGRNDSSGAVLVLSEFLLIPLMMGFLSAFLWRRIEIHTGYFFLNSAINVGLGLVMSFIVLREGVICLIMVSPLLLVFVTLGALIGRYAFRKSRKLSVSFAPVLLALLVLDARLPHDHQQVVVTTERIHAPPERIWANVVVVPRVTPPSHYWLFRLGLPRPVRTTATGQRVGERRDCIFEGNLAFEERITELEPARVLTFDVVKQPAYPEILGHMDLLRGQMLLQDNGDGTTTLIGRTWYRLRAYPAWYFDLWAEDVCHEVHRSVMGHIRRLAESPR